ncbi:MAG: hypothetical protein IJT79_01655, partial [Ruminococcus sp.]|nr:hypothetical protein [Ruminococcus sp.]
IPPAIKNALFRVRILLAEPAYFQYIYAFNFVCCGVCTWKCSATLQAKNSPQDCFLYALSNPACNKKRTLSSAHFIG